MPVAGISERSMKLKSKIKSKWLKKKEKTVAADSVTVYVDVNCVVRNASRLLADLDQLEAGIRTIKEALANMSETPDSGPSISLSLEEDQPESF